MLKNSSHRNDDFSPDSAEPKSPVFSIIMPLSWHIHAWLTHLNGSLICVLNIRPFLPMQWAARKINWWKFYTIDELDLCISNCCRCRKCYAFTTNTANTVEAFCRRLPKSICNKSNLVQVYTSGQRWKIDGYERWIDAKKVTALLCEEKTVSFRSREWCIKEFILRQN